jgi:hypothetical protein
MLEERRNERANQISSLLTSLSGLSDIAQQKLTAPPPSVEPTRYLLDPS